MQLILVRGISREAEHAAEETLRRELVSAGAINAQAQDTAREVTIIFRANLNA